MKNYIGTVVNECSFVRELDPVISARGNKSRVAEWRCGCGNIFKASIGNVTSGQVKSCGCKKTAAVIKRCTKHGHSPDGGGTKLYRFWQSMKERCLNPKSTSYGRYGGRGIKMYSEWQGSFENFSEYFTNHFGLDDIPSGLSMDRRDNDGDYAPGNIRLATLTVQANNRRNNRIVTYQGKNLTVAQLSRLVGVKSSTIRARLDIQFKTVEEAVK